MIYINHRVNQISELKNIATENGVEIDIRAARIGSTKFHLQHEPWVGGDDFEKWLKEWVKLRIKGPLILNTKEDGLEAGLLELLRENEITNYFFLDTALPTLVKWTEKLGNRNFAVRISAYEPLEFALKFIGKVDWCWIDCFDGVPLTRNVFQEAKKHFKVCLVSPELQGFDFLRIEDFKEMADTCDAICTKDPNYWKKVLLKLDSTLKNKVSSYEPI